MKSIISFLSILITLFGIGGAIILINLGLKNKNSDTTNTDQSSPFKEVIVANYKNKTAELIFITNDPYISSKVEYWSESNIKKKLQSIDQSPIEEEHNIQRHILSNLEPNTTYFYNINLNENIYKNDEFSFKTPSIFPKQEELDTMNINGKIDTEVVGEGIVFAHLLVEDEETTSTIIASNILQTNKFNIPLHLASTKDGGVFLNSYPNAKIIVFAFVQNIGRGASILNSREETLLLELSPSTDPYVGASRKYINQEYNSINAITSNTYEETTATPTSNTASLELLNVINRSIIPYEKDILGKAEPNSIIQIKIGEYNFETRSGNNGIWKFKVTSDIPEGRYTTKFRSKNDEIKIDIGINQINLPDTSQE